MTLQEAKDKAAREYGYPNFEIAATLIAAHVIIDRAMEIYAEGVVKSKKKKSKINPYEPTGFKAINAKPTKP